MIYEAAYYDNGKVVKYESGNWKDFPEKGLLWVIIKGDKWTHRLKGGDYYWVKDNSYGMIYDGSCCAIGASTWTVVNGKSIKVKKDCPEDAYLIEGILLPDEEWERIS